MNAPDVAAASVSLRLKSAKIFAWSIRIRADSLESFFRLDRAIGEDFKNQAIEIGYLTNSCVFHNEVDLLDRREDSIDRDLPNRIRLLVLGRTISAISGNPEIHIENRVGAGECGNNLIRIDYLNLGRPRNIAGSYDALARTVGAYIEMGARFTVEFGDTLQSNTLQIQNNFDNVLADIVNRREFMPNALDLNTRNGHAFKRSKQNAAKSITERCAVSGLQWLDLVPAVN